MRKLLFVLVAACLVALGAAFAGQAGAGKPYQVVYFDGHMHTVESDGSGTVEDIKVAALKRGLSAVIVTNHTKMLTLDEWRDLNRRTRALSESGFIMLNAFEVTGSEGLFNRDHVLAWGVRDPFVGDDARELAPEEAWESPHNPAGTGALFPESIAKWTRYIRRNGGISVHAHTTGTTDPAYGVDFIEVFNLSHVKDVAFYARAMGFSPAEAWGLGLTLNNMALYGERDLSMMVTLPGAPAPMPLRTALYAATQSMTGVGEVLGAPEAPLRSWDDLLMGYIRGDLKRPTFGVANSDAHNTYNVEGHEFSGGSGDVHGDYADDYSDVGEAKNGVLVRSLSRRSLLEAIRAGRCFATTGPSLSFTVNGMQMGETARIAKRCARPAILRLKTSAGEPTAVIAQVRIVRNGETWRTFSPMTPVFDTTLCDDEVGSGYYRVEVTSVDGVGGEYRFAYSNPVFVKVRGR